MEYLLGDNLQLTTVGFEAMWLPPRLLKSITHQRKCSGRQPLRKGSCLPQVELKTNKTHVLKEETSVYACFHWTSYPSKSWTFLNNGFIEIEVT